MNKVWLPAVYNGAEINKSETVFWEMSFHPDQGRKEMHWNTVLERAAVERLKDQAENRWDGHVHPSGQGANDWVRSFDYKLPSYYGTGEDNSVESLGYGGNGTIEQMWETWMNSEHHRTHILGLNSFFAGQTQVGIGYFYLKESEHKYYWCILTAPKEENDG